MVQDLLPPTEFEISFYKHSRPSDPEFPNVAGVDWQVFLENLSEGAVGFLKKELSEAPKCWAIVHFLEREFIDWSLGEIAGDLCFEVFALEIGDTIPCSSMGNNGRRLYGSSECDWWDDFVGSLKSLDLSKPPPALGDWDSYLEMIYRAQVLSAFDYAQGVLGLKRKPRGLFKNLSARVANIFDNREIDGELKVFMNFEGETAEEVMNATNAYEQCVARLSL